MKDFLPPLEQLEDAASVVYETMAPTPQYAWALLKSAVGAEIWVKHENHTPVGAFKVRGGIVFARHLKESAPEVTGVIAATRGNHGQSVAFAAKHLGLHAVIVVPRGNSVEKNAAMAALGAELVEAGHDFQASLEHAQDLARERRLHFFPSFHEKLIQGVGTYALELFAAAPPLHSVYVPIGLGSGICGVMAARDALGLATRVVGVVAENAPAYALSFSTGKPVSTNSADTMADGLACRVPVPEAVEAINKGVERVVSVSEEEIKAAMRAYFADTHNVAEGAGAAPLAALLRERDKMAGRRVALILTGANVDSPVYQQVLAAGAA
jgi:threonine dehydratase